MNSKHNPFLLSYAGTQKAGFTLVPWGCPEKLAWSDCRVAEILRSGGYIAFLDTHLFLNPSVMEYIRKM